MTETILLCEGTPEGIFTGVYTAYEKRLNPNTTHIQLGEIENYRLFAQYIEVETDLEKAVKVERSLHKRLGNRTAEILWYAVSSYDPKRGDGVYHTIARGLAGAYRGELMDYLQDPYINLVAKLHVNVWNEVHHYMGFVRFAELRSGILYSEIEPKNQVLLFLGEHFADRFPQEKFLIRDKGRNQYLIHRAKEECFLFSDRDNYLTGEGDQIFSENEQSKEYMHTCPGEGKQSKEHMHTCPEEGKQSKEHMHTCSEEEEQSKVHTQVCSEERNKGFFHAYSREEEQIQQLFRCFVHSISIESRENRKLQRQMLPLRFRPNMVDFQ